MISEEKEHLHTGQVKSDAFTVLGIVLFYCLGSTNIVLLTFWHRSMEHWLKTKRQMKWLRFLFLLSFSVEFQSEAQNLNYTVEHPPLKPVRLVLEVGKHFYCSDPKRFPSWRTQRCWGSLSDPATSFPSHDLSRLQHQLWDIRHHTPTCCPSRPAAFLWDQMCPLSQSQVVHDLCPRLFFQSRDCPGAGQTGIC